MSTPAAFQDIARVWDRAAGRLQAVLCAPGAWWNNLAACRAAVGPIARATEPPTAYAALASQAAETAAAHTLTDPTTRRVLAQRALRDAAWATIAWTLTEASLPLDHEPTAADLNALTTAYIAAVRAQRAAAVAAKVLLTLPS